MHARTFIFVSKLWPAHGGVAGRLAGLRLMGRAIEGEKKTRPGAGMQGSG